MSDPAGETYLIVSQGEAETLRLGGLIAQVLRPGDVLGLIGDLGAGKTRLTQAIAIGLGVPAADVNSPTFTLIQEYSGRYPLRHCDTYRLRHPSEFAELGIEELFGEDGIALVEWADRVREDLPRDRLELTISATGASIRAVEFRALGPRSRELLADIIRAHEEARG